MQDMSCVSGQSADSAIRTLVVVTLQRERGVRITLMQPKVFTHLSYHKEKYKVIIKGIKDLGDLPYQWLN